MPPGEVLGVAPGASPGELAAAFRRFALRHHPDRGGDPVRFQAGVEEYHRLTERRRTGTKARAAASDVVFHRRSRVRASSLVRLARRRLASSLRP